MASPTPGSLDLWRYVEKIPTHCWVHLSEIVMGEADYYEDSEGIRHDIDLTWYVKGGQIQIFSR